MRHAAYTENSGSERPQLRINVWPDAPDDMMVYVGYDENTGMGTLVFEDGGPDPTRGDVLMITGTIEMVRHVWSAIGQQLEDIRELPVEDIRELPA